MMERTRIAKGLKPQSLILTWGELAAGIPGVAALDAPPPGDLPLRVQAVFPHSYILAQSFRAQKQSSDQGRQHGAYTIPNNPIWAYITDKQPP